MEESFMESAMKWDWESSYSMKCWTISNSACLGKEIIYSSFLFFFLMENLRISLIVV
ncbi:MAG: hypothetical protein ACFE9S_17755 [Candidatus Hermodarchaeota archaeon]